MVTAIFAVTMLVLCRKTIEWRRILADRSPIFWRAGKPDCRDALPVLNPANFWLMAEEGVVDKIAGIYAGICVQLRDFSS
jgi:hypothetical protein